MAELISKALSNCNECCETKIRLEACASGVPYIVTIDTSGGTDVYTYTNGQTGLVEVAPIAGLVIGNCATLGNLASPALKPRVKDISTTFWNKAVDAPNATSVTVTLVSGTLTINDGINTTSTLVDPISFTWGDSVSKTPLGTNLTFDATTPNTQVIVHWVEI